ncbi:unnamed protein product [Urochloa humidicola]
MDNFSGGSGSGGGGNNSEGGFGDGAGDRGPFSVFGGGFNKSSYGFSAGSSSGHAPPGAIPNLDLNMNLQWPAMGGGGGGSPPCLADLHFRRSVAAWAELECLLTVQPSPDLEFPLTGEPSPDLEFRRGDAAAAPPVPSVLTHLQVQAMDLCVPRREHTGCPRPRLVLLEGHSGVKLGVPRL